MYLNYRLRRKKKGGGGRGKSDPKNFLFIIHPPMSHIPCEYARCRQDSTHLLRVCGRNINVCKKHYFDWFLALRTKNTDAFFLNIKNKKYKTG